VLTAWTRKATDAEVAATQVRVAIATFRQSRRAASLAGTWEGLVGAVRPSGRRGRNVRPSGRCGRSVRASEDAVRVNGKREKRRAADIAARAETVRLVAGE
jgi:hypothetical protein